MYFLKTQLKNFRFNTTIHKGPFNVTCYKLSEEDEEIEGACMTHEELTRLTNYIANNHVNFGIANYHSCVPDDVPYMTDFAYLPAKSGFPKYLIIRVINIINYRPDSVGDWTDVELLSESGIPNKIIPLPFDLVVKIDH